ncbi:MAG: lipid-binding SYLF domain-containing protein [Alphaproteobacteria bacterium]|nr:lipid-binding SYLF domain-containing protein [Alphaproteobacteria bacterium]
MIRSIRPTLYSLLLVLLVLGSCRSAGEFGSEPEQLIDRSRITFQSMMSDNQYPGLVDLASRAKAIIIVPSMLRAGFFVGGRGGNAVMLVRNGQGWSPPAFYTIGGLSFGLQFGGESSELVITVMTDKGLYSVLDRQVTLGGDAGVAVGELGKGVNASTGMGLKSDMYAFARSQGLYVGVSLEGSVIAPRHTWNQQLYGIEATPRSILIDHTSSSSSQSVSAIIAAMP